MENHKSLEVFIQPNYLVLKLSGKPSLDDLASMKASVMEAEETIKSLFSKEGRKIKILLDMSEWYMGHDMEADSQIMELMTLFARQNSTFVNRTAAFGGPSEAQSAGEIVASFADRDNIRFFKTKEEALAWLE